MRNLSLAMVFQTLVRECMESKTESFVVENIIIDCIDKNIDKCASLERYSIFFETVMKKMVGACTFPEIAPIISKKVERIIDTVRSLSRFKFFNSLKKLISF